MKNIQLFLGTDRLKVDTTELTAPTISYSIKDIKNFGQKNASFTKPISVYHTANTDRIFKGLFNINSYGGYDVGTKVYGELQENGITILKGTVQVVGITLNTYEIILFSNNLSIFDDIGEELIYGNQDAVLDVQFDASSFLHTWSRDLIRTQLNTDASLDGTGYTYPIINYDNALTWPLPLDFNPLRPNRFKDDYIVLPAIAAKQIFDKIFENNGYSYEMSSEIEGYLKKLYIPFNNDIINYTVENYKYGKYYLGNPTDLAYTTTTVQLSPYQITNWSYSEIVPQYSVIGWTFADSYLAAPNHVSGGYDYIIDRSSTDKSIEKNIILPHAGQYVVDVSLYLYNTSSNAKSTEWSLSYWNTIDGNITKPIGRLDLAGNTGGYINAQVEVPVSEKSSMYVHRSPKSDTAINLIFGPWTYIELNEKNSFIGANNQFELNNILPSNYKKADFLNDIFKMFNAFITVDEIDEKKLYIKTYRDFFSSGIIYDWSQKIDNNSIKFTPIKNTFAKNTYFSFTDDNDIYSTDYLSKYPKGIFTKQVINDSEFASADNEIKLSCSQGIITIAPYSDLFITNPKAPTGGARILTISDDKQFKTAWKPKLLFVDSVDISAFIYGSDASAVADPYIRKWRTLGPRLSSDISDADNLFIGFDSTNTYTSGLWRETNETLYNKFYKEDLESNLSDDSYLLEAKFYLDSEDIAKVSFDDIIKISHSKLGSAFYRLNAIKDYVPGGSLTTVELLKINLVDGAYDASIATDIVYRSITADGGTPGAGSGSSSSGGGGTGTTGSLQDVTNIGNTTINDIVLINSGTPSSQVAIQANADDELTIDGVSIEDKFLHQVATADRFIISNTNGDSSTYEWAKYDKINDKIVLDKTIEINGILNSVSGDLIIQPNTGALNLYSDTGNEINIDAQNSFLEINADAGIRIIDDVSLGGDIYADSIESHYPFMSGFTGDGYQLTKQSDGDYRLEIDDLYVRGSLTAYEFILNKIRANNGALWVSAAVEAVWPGDNSTPQSAGLFWDADVSCMYFTCDIGNNTLDTDDIIRSQQFTGAGIYQLDYKVYDVSTSRVYVVNLDDSSAAYVDVTDKTFVRIGNVSNTDRQGALYLTASDTNSPYMEILNDMSSNTIDQYHRKVRLGKLNGLNWNDISIGGYGLYAQNAYLTGGILANFGKIGNFDIQDGLLKGTGIAGDTITLNPDLPSIILSDASGGIVAHFTNEAILAIDDIQEGTELSYVGGVAGQYTAITWKYNQNLSGYYSGPYTLNPSIYIDNKYTYNSALEASTGKKGAQYALQTNAGTRFNTNMYVNINLAYVLPESSAFTLNGKPTDIPTEYASVITNSYSFGGAWSVNASTFFYDGSNNLLETATVGTTSGLTGNKTNWQVVTNKNIIANDTSTYIVFKPKISNGLYLNEEYKVWEAYEPYWDMPGYYEWQEVYSANFQRDISANFTVDVETLTMNGTFQMTQIGQDGILTYWDDTKYFTVNNRENPLIQSAGGWTHNMTSSQNIRINHNGESASFSSPFALACAEQGWMMILQNKRNNSDAQGILLDVGAASGTNYVMSFRTSGGFGVGSITHDGTNTTYGIISDARLKDNVRDASIDALSIIESLPVREWEWNTSGENDCGFVAQEVLEIFPRMVQVPNDPSTQYYGVGTQHLVPILVKALQEAMDRIEKLELDVSILKG